MTLHTDTPAWALAEYARNQREHDAAKRRLARDDQWLRLWETRMKVAPDASTFNRRYAAALDAGMARLDAEREAEGQS